MNKVSDSVSVLYFASLGEQLGCAQENITLDSNTTPLSHLKNHIAARGGNWQRLSSDETLLCAVNQTITHDDPVLKSGDEIAFFPPVTGG